MESNNNSSRKIIYFLLSVLVACGIWLYADLTSGPNGAPRTCIREITDIPIEYTREATLTDRGLMLVEDGSDLTVDLELEGTRSLVTKLDREQIRFVVDLSNVTSAGVQNIGYSVSYTDNEFRNGAISTKNVSIGGGATVNISELYRRTIDVSCELVGNVAETYTAGQVQLSHTEIEVRGLQEDIDPISYAKVTLDIGDSVEETVSQELELQFYDQDGNLLDDSRIHATVETIQATLPVFVTKELRLVVNFIEAPGARVRNTDAHIEPETITVSGDATQLKNVETLTLDNHFNLLDLGTSASSNYTTTYYPIIPPEGCQNLSGVTRAALKIRFEDMTSASVPTENITLANLSEGRTATLLTTSLPVQIYGTEADVSAVAGEDIAVTVDLSDYSSASGTYTIPAEVRVSGGDLGITGEYQVQVTIRERVEEPPEEPTENPQEPEDPAEE